MLHTRAIFQRVRISLKSILFLFCFMLIFDIAGISDMQNTTVACDSHSVMVYIRKIAIYYHIVTVENLDMLNTKSISNSCSGDSIDSVRRR